MAPRQQLEDDLKELLGTEEVHFQPPPGFMMSYPCIIYSRSNIRSRHGDNLPYKLDNEYTITVITQNPDSDLPDKVAKLPRCIFDRPFTSDNLYHYVFNILY